MKSIPALKLAESTFVPILITWRRVLLILQVFIILVLAAALEVGGDALVRMGLEGTAYYLIAGGLTLFVYGIVVNKSDLDFNRLMGVYIAVFFVVSQIISFVLFKQIPDSKILLGGSFIVGGGLIISMMA
jgi:drug/metabolite transporter superfamily protein YnfA